MKNLSYGRNEVLHLEPKRPYRYNDRLKRKESRERTVPKEVKMCVESFEDTNTESTHTRQPTMIINNLSQSQRFISALSNVPSDGLLKLETSLDFWDYGVGSLDLNFEYDSDEFLSDISRFEDAENTQEPLKSFTQDSTKNSIKQSLVVESKSYITHKTGKKTKILGKLKESTNAKPTLSTHENEPDSYREKNYYYGKQSGSPQSDFINYITSKAYCPKCQCEVSTTVKFKFPSMTFWQKLCCRTCYGSGDFKEILYHCKKCKTLITKIKRSKK
ncbi:unnamed protein product [Blepharisma stoltei]|uniref:LITAF domain-containing protein n=1 Tax=Blepharisma stoltei TaxID=1481888 RepID=A0AAU9IPR1_9CILI|nr:unnamed protein product [Blepharisma stoltei]